MTAQTPDERKAEAAEVVRLFRRGKSADDIAEEIGAPLKRVQNIIGNRLRQTKGLVEHRYIRMFIQDQIQRVLVAMADKVDEGDPEACRVVLSALDRAARLTGADAPSRQSVDLDATIKRIERKIVDPAD